MSNLPPDWYAERLDHYTRCAVNCPYPLVVKDDSETECEAGHTSHECNCDDLMEGYINEY